MHHLRFRQALLLALLALLPAGAPTGAAAQTPSGRPSDSLLQRPDLQHLVDLQVQRDGPALIRALQDPDPAVRARAAFALASVQDTAAVAPLLEQLDDPDRHVRADAAFALGQMPAAVPSARLVEALRAEEDLVVQQRLVEAFGKTGDAASLVQLVLLDLPEALAAEVALAIGRYGLRDVHAPEAVAYLIGRLGSTDATVRRQAAYYFGRVRRTDPWAGQADAIRKHLDALPPADEAALHLLAALGRLEDTRDAQRLVGWLREGEDWRIRTNAARALSGLTALEEVRRALLEALDDASTHVAVTAAEVLTLAPSWTEPEAAEVQAWIQAHPAAWRTAAPLLRGLAAQGEAAFVLDHLDHLRSADVLPYARSLPALAAVSRVEALERLAAEAAHPDVRVAYEALSALATRWQRDRADPALTRRYFDVFAGALRRRDLATAYAAAPVLGDTLFRSLGSVQLMEEVYRQLRTPEDTEPMTAILGALGTTGDPRAEPLLREALAHPHPVLRRAAAEALQQLTGATVPPSAGTEPAARTVDWDRLAPLGPRPRLILETEKGTVVLVLDAEQAPLTAQTLLTLAADGAYDGVPFHRVVPNFVIQGGDFERGDGFGGPGFSIRSEFTRLPYRRGTAGMASAGKDTEGSQYFITHSMQPHLDGRYTAFGHVLEGMEVVDHIYENDRVVRAHVVNSHLEAVEKVQE